MRCSISYLDKCYELHQSGFRFDFDKGKKVARGFADLGYEEFYLLPGEKIVSVFTGSVAPFDDQAGEHFFVIPSSADLIVAIEQLDFDLKALDYCERRTWRLQLSHISTNDTQSFEGVQIEQALIAGLLYAYHFSLNKLKQVNAD